MIGHVRVLTIPDRAGADHEKTGMTDGRTATESYGEEQRELNKSRRAADLNAHSAVNDVCRADTAPEKS